MPPGYVMDEMEFYEAEAMLERLHDRHKAGWEQTRMICYVMAQANSTKALKPEDILKFPWDREAFQTGDTDVSDHDRERLKRKAQQFINQKSCQQI